MPYIKQEDRKKFEDFVDGCSNVSLPGHLSSKIENEGELNYVITLLCHGYLKKHGLRYHNIARISGVLKNVSDEFYRRVVAPYEDGKIAENGDVPEE